MSSSVRKLVSVVGWATLTCVLAACTARQGSSTLRWSMVDDVERPTPAVLHGLFARGSATCGFDPDGALLCWLAFGDATAKRFEPPFTLVSVAFADDVGAVGCVMDAEHRIWCWDDFEQLYAGPHAIVGLGRRRVFVELALSEAHGCARLDDGRVACWGRNFAGQLGRDVDERCNATDERASDHARVVPGVHDVIDVAVGAAFGCTAHRDGSVRCWGRADYGELGNPPAPGCQPPRVIAGLAAIVAIAADNQVACALDQDGAVWCWGSEYDQDPSWKPCPVPLPRPATAIEVDRAVGIVRATLDDGRVMQWRPAYACAGEPVTPTATDAR